MSAEPTIADDRDDADVPELALAALRAAQERARQTGRPRVLVRDRKVVRVDGETVVVLKVLPPRKRVRPRQP